WNRDGALLVNGVAQQPFPQPRLLDQPGTLLKWEHGRPSQADTLSVSWARAGRLLAAANDDGFVRVWDIDRGEVKASLFHQPRWGVRAAIAPDGKTVASANWYAPDVILWDVASGEKIATLSAPGQNVKNVRFLSDDWLLEFRADRLNARHLAGDRSRVIELGKLHPHTHDLGAIPLSSDGRTLALFDEAKVTTHRVEIKPDGLTLKSVSTTEERFGEPIMALSPDGTLLAVYDGLRRDNRALAVYDAATGVLKHRLRWRKTSAIVNEVSSMCFLPDGKTLAVGGTDVVRLFDLDSRRERAWITTPWVRELAVSGDGKLLAAGFRHNASLRVWDVAGVQPPAPRPHPAP